jgi:hypothetical protein
MVYTKSIFKRIERYCEKNRKKWEEEILKRQKLSSKKRRKKPSKPPNYESFRETSTLYKAFPFYTPRVGNIGKRITNKTQKEHK